MKKLNLGAPVSRYDGENVPDGVGFTLGNARRLKRLGLRQVAQSLGVSPQFISNIEHGRAPLPSKYAVRVSRLLGLDQTEVAGLSVLRAHVFRKLKRVSV